ncbi:hypothetical protein GWN63_01300 [Candidatus Bathyarchaeota archaeon]|nr:hypothetical protein [Candidatus Bathyarchaeota archaeon]NIU80873.1 hypothetical protein [Candidatus Bathyarchaeota archaeon]NIW33953.1 hypothetical protein [Candidatus Bathyarchaeota archaeon]
MEGEKFAVRFEYSNLIVDSDGERSIQIKSEIEDEDVLDFFEEEAAGVLGRYDVDAIELDCVSIKNDPRYIFPGPVIVLENAMAMKGGNHFFLAPETLPTMSSYFGTVSVPQFNPPTALLLAIQKGQKGKVNALIKRIKSFPSMYGVADHTPKYYCCIGRIASPEERELRWPI